LDYYVYDCLSQAQYSHDEGTYDDEVCAPKDGGTDAEDNLESFKHLCMS